MQPIKTFLFSIVRAFLSLDNTLASQRARVRLCVLLRLNRAISFRLSSNNLPLGDLDTSP